MNYPIMDEDTLAKRWSLSPKTLQRWRKEGLGAAWHSLFGLVRYHATDISIYELEIHRWCEACAEKELPRDKMANPFYSDGELTEPSDVPIFLSSVEMSLMTSLPMKFFSPEYMSKIRMPHRDFDRGMTIRFHMPDVLAWEIRNSTKGTQKMAARRTTGVPA
jgi:hypothetical protein